MKLTKDDYYCDRCQKLLPTCNNNVSILIDSLKGLGELQVDIIYKIGASRRADLCRVCAHSILNDAAVRVVKGERASKGIESEYKEGFDGGHAT